MRAPRPMTAVVALALLAGCSGQPTSIVLATTTSTQDSGLLDELVPRFTDATGIAVKTIAVGSGQAIELARRGEADVVLVHSPADEEALVADGATGRRLLVMHNDFVLVGPDDDPAGVAGADVDDALETIAATGSPFVSRGDDSGTHTKELALWSVTGTDPAGDWYVETGQGMAATLRVADERRGYALADRATYLSQADTLALEVVVEGDPGLLNVYHVIEMTAAAGDRVEADGAAAFADWIVSDPAQETIGAFGAGEFGRPLFVPDAGKDLADLTG